MTAKTIEATNTQLDWMVLAAVNSEDSVCTAGPTTLIAAMRCYVTLELGDKVEVPDELI